MKKTLVLALLLFPTSLFATDQTGVFARGERYEPPTEHAPASVSRMFVRTVTRQAAAVDLPATGDSGMIVWTIPVSQNANARRPGARLTTPTGDVLRPHENGSLERGLRRFRFDSSEVGIDLPSASHEVFHVLRSEAASYRLDVDVPADVAGVIVAVAEPDSPITMETWMAPLSRQPGEPVTLHARLREGDDAINGARVTGRLSIPGSAAGAPIELIERGDGIYTATLTDIPGDAAGVWQARFEANGRTAAGVRFARTGSGELISERGAARLRPGSIRATRADGMLRVTASANVVVPGAYRFDVIMASNGEALAWGEGARQLMSGENELVLEIPLESHSGPLHLDVRLLGLDEVGVAGRMSIDVR